MAPLSIHWIASSFIILSVALWPSCRAETGQECEIVNTEDGVESSPAACPATAPVGEDFTNTTSSINTTLCWEIPNNELTETERETKLNQLLENSKQKKRLEASKEHKLLQMLQDWKSVGETAKEAGMKQWYETAKEEVFTFKGAERQKEEDGSEWTLDAEKGAALLHWLDSWDDMYETDSSSAMYDFYREVSVTVFGLAEYYEPTPDYDEEDEERTDPSDPWRVSSYVDSHHGTHYDLQQYFECAEWEDRAVEPYNDPMIWRFLRYHYVGIVGPEKSSLVGMEGTGFLVDVEFNYAEGKGRGVFAKEFIPKNTIVANSTMFAGVFDNAVDFRRFIVSLPQNIACDCLMWAYAEATDQFDPESMLMEVDFDGQGLLNNGNYDGDRKYVNLNADPRSEFYYATRDILPGEELQLNYDDFETEVYRWEYFGL